MKKNDPFLVLYFFCGYLQRGGGGRGLAESEISLSENTEIFLDFFSKGGGVFHNPKGCHHKKLGILGYFCQKGGSHPIHRDFIIKN